LKHFTRSVIEGITFSLKESKVIMEQRKNLKIKKIISVGGGTKNQQWLQIQADIFGLPITTLETELGPSLGAAILAVIGCGMCAN
ncbi:FGGY-family carbohydrate kinase, partial [Enterococcus faecalis]